MLEKTLEHAGFWRRCAAYIIDYSILSIVLINIHSFFLSPLLIQMQMHNSISSSVYWFVAVSVSLGVFSSQWAYFIAMETSPLKATLGKLLSGLYVTNLDGERISLAQANGRFFGKFLSALILCVGFLMAAFTQNKQALHDVLANTLVLKK